MHLQRIMCLIAQNDKGRPKMKRKLGLFVATVAGILGTTCAANAQQQPFQNIQQAPTVSPYLNLVNNNNASRGVPVYQTLVEPFLQQQQQQQQINQLQKTTQQLTTGGLTQPREALRTRFVARGM